MSVLLFIELMIGPRNDHVCHIEEREKEFKGYEYHLTGVSILSRCLDRKLGVLR